MSIHSFLAIMLARRFFDKRHLHYLLDSPIPSHRNNNFIQLTKMANEYSSLVGNGDRSSPLTFTVRKEACCQIFTVIFLVFFGITCIATSVFVVPPGMLGIVVTFGHVKDHESGLYLRAPLGLSSLEVFSAKTQKLEEQNTTPTKEGLSVQLDTVVLFRLEPSMVKSLYIEVGPDYIQTLLQPEANSAVRCYTSESEAKDLYTAGRLDIQNELKANLSEKLKPRGIIIEDVLLKDLVLPEMLARSIELKLETEQDAKQMVFVLEKERFEADRKKIEAQGIAAFQNIVSEGISAQLLQWKGIEATERLANSPNTKIVIMGNDAKGLPVLLSASDNESDGVRGVEQQHNGTGF